MKPYPTQQLVFYVDEEADDSIRNAVHEMIEELSSAREWLLGPPEFIDEVDDPETDSAEDLPIETVGGVLEIYSALAPISLLKDLDAMHYREVVAIVEAVKKISRSEKITFDFELDGVFVGLVKDGKINKTLQSGLLDPWREHLGL